VRGISQPPSASQRRGGAWPRRADRGRIGVSGLSACRL